MAQLWPLNPALTQLGEKKFQKYRRKVVNIAKAVLATNPEDIVVAFDAALPGMWIVKNNILGTYELPYGVVITTTHKPIRIWLSPEGVPVNGTSNSV
jgi:hypothetical protein